MFPRQFDEFKGSGPGIYFSDCEAPTYLVVSLGVPEEIPQIAEEIRDLAHGSDICGYIADDAIYFHYSPDKSFFLDSSKDFIFIYDHDIREFTHPGSLAILRFLQDPCDRALFI